MLKKQKKHSFFSFFFAITFFSASNDASHYRNLYENVNIKLKYCIILTKVNGSLIFKKGWINFFFPNVGDL